MAWYKRVAPAPVAKEAAGVVPGGAVHVESKTGLLARSLVHLQEDWRQALQEAARAQRSEPQVLPRMPEAFQQQMAEWAWEVERDAELSASAAAFSVAMLIASQLGQLEKAKAMMAKMEKALEKEASTACRAWLLGRQMLCCAQLQLEEPELRGLLDSLLLERLAKDARQLEVISDPREAWAWSYLLLSGQEESQDLMAWTKASRMVWASVEDVHRHKSEAERMWTITMALLAFARLPAAHVLAQPLAAEAAKESFQDILSVLCAKPGKGPKAEGVLSLREAMRRIPGDFRAWAVSLVRLAHLRADVEVDLVELQQLFEEAMSEAAAGGRALAASSWALAEYISIWKEDRASL
ncbi:unnamed protein product [Effrenium voratum]|nr:unnamed protein product [Effrenium voratum]